MDINVGIIIKHYVLKKYERGFYIIGSRVLENRRFYENVWRSSENMKRGVTVPV